MGEIALDYYVKKDHYTKKGLESIKRVAKGYHLPVVDSKESKMVKIEIPLGLIFITDIIEFFVDKLEIKKEI